MSTTDPAIVIGIPGRWKDRTEIVANIASRSGGYLFAGMMLVHIATGRMFRLDIEEHNPSLAAFMRKEGMGLIPEDDLAALENHTFTLYLVSDQTGRDVVSEMMSATLALLDSGGIAVKIDTAGLSISAAQWRELCGMPTARPLYRGMVILVGEQDDHFTCGMRAFSLPDCQIVGSPLEEAFKVASEFNCYQIDETPDLAEGHTFSLAEGVRRYRLSFGSYPYPPGDFRHNPNGMWTLAPEG